jgi:hypothetical protein
MRSQIFVALIGLFTGALGALVAGGLSSPREPAHHSERAVPPAAVAPAGIVPPGWDPRFVAAIASQRATAPAPPSLAVAPPPSAARTEPDDKERGQKEHYAQELEHRENELASHDHEGVDRGWADGAAATIRQALAAGERSFVVKSVDCRTKTCVAELTYPSPTEAVAGQAALASVGPAGCHGMFSTLTPPTSEGAYDATVVYYCR